MTSTKDVLDHHIKCFGEGDLTGILSDYAPGAVASTPLAWLSANDIAYYASEFKRTGFRGGLNWYRNSDRNWELSAPWTGAKIQVPALCMIGDRDIVYKARGMDQALANPTQFAPRLQDSIILKGCGHWIQQERARQVNDALLQFLREL
jgi:pimeloyl-ACP methyl ester carboxylesterase